MATNLIKFPLDLDGGGGQGPIAPEYHHLMVFRIYSNSSASLMSKNTEVEGGGGGNTPENELLANLDSSRGQQENVHTDVSWGGTGIDDMTSAAKTFFKDTVASRAKKKNQDAIYLPFPQTINMKDSWNWESVSFQKTAFGEALKGEAGDAFTKSINSILGTVSGIVHENGEKAGYHAMRKVVNPRKETMFNDPAMRTFSFEFDFAPRNKEESEAAQKIIQLFKYHSSPELYEGNALYRFCFKWCRK